MQSPTAVGAFASVLGPTFKLADNGFEIRAEDEQARGLLQTVQQVASQLDNARLLQRQRSGRFSDNEKRLFEETYRNCEDAIRSVASLAEPPRSGITAGANVPVIFTLRDSPSINVSLTQLGIARQNLDMTIRHLSSRDSRPSSSAGSPPIQSTSPNTYQPSPLYGESQFLAAGRRRNMARRASAMGNGNAPPADPPPQHHPPPQSVQPAPRMQAIHPDRTRALSSSAMYIPPSIPELVGDDTFSRPAPVRHTTLPVITIANGYVPPSDLIVVENEPVEQPAALSPPRSPAPLSQSTSSPPGSPPVLRHTSVSSHTSEPTRQSKIYTPPQSTGVRTPPNSWAPQFQEPRPPPMNLAPNQNIVIPVRTIDHRTPHPSVPPQLTTTNLPPPQRYSIVNPDPHTSSPQSAGAAPPIPVQHSGRRTSAMDNWSAQQSQNYRPISTNLSPPSNVGIGIRTSMASIPDEAYSTNFAGAPTPGLGADSKYIYSPSLARRGRGGRNRSHSWLDARAQ